MDNPRIITTPGGEQHLVGRNKSVLFTDEPTPQNKIHYIVDAMFESGIKFEDVVLEFNGVQVTLDELENYTRVYKLVDAANRRARAKLKAQEDQERERERYNDKHHPGWRV